jgi:hypothetical protein
MCWGAIADWLVAAGTLIVAAVAVFQEPIRGWFYRPRFEPSVQTKPPDCVMVPYIKDGTCVGNAVYLRLWVKNVGTATAKNAEVYASKLRRQRADGSWEPIDAFPPMNLKWANLGKIYFPGIAPWMRKQCDIGHMIDPAHRHILDEVPFGLASADEEKTSLAFDLMAAPSIRAHIVGPGEYRLDILLAAENARPVERTIAISVRGTWYADETTMLRDGVGVSLT